MPGLHKQEKQDNAVPTVPPEPEYVPTDEEGKVPFEYDESLVAANLDMQGKTPEALMVVNMDMYGAGGGRVITTFRGHDAMQIVANMKELASALNHEFGLTTQPQGYVPSKTNGASTQQAQQQDVQPDRASRGTDVLNFVQVDADGTISFGVGAFKWPFKDKRGAQIVARLFDRDLGFDSETLGKPAYYKPETDWDGTLWVDWEKGGKDNKYYNVVRIHA